MKKRPGLAHFFKKIEKKDSDYCKKSVALSRIFVFERSEIKTKLSDRQWLTNIFNGAHVRQNNGFLQNMTIHRTVQKTKARKGIKGGKKIKKGKDQITDSA